ncbi:MAG: non-heme iron oxygenase ferredoxin subunit [Mariprofundaceae bacterium]|nr:non-heme iron oxygenase ferredoxin subunit [Mariprofundaceae bacterium]
MAEWVDVAPAGELQAGQRKVVYSEAGPIAVFNLAGELFAIEDLCTHDGGELASGALDGDQIICPRHGSRFCIRTGRVLSPPAYEDIETFPIRIENETVQVDIDA